MVLLEYLTNEAWGRLVQPQRGAALTNVEAPGVECSYSSLAELDLCFW